MKKVTVIGIGSRIMGDDGIGVYVVEELLKQKFMPNSKYLIEETDIEFVVGETDIDCCLDSLDNTSTVIIIDAAISGKTPCTVTQFAMNDNVTYTNRILSAHNLSIIEAAKTRITSNNIIIIGIEPEVVDYQLGLSETLNTSFIQILDNVKTYIMKMYLGIQ